jgi:TPR repeat protein
LARRGDAGAALKVGELFEAGRGVAQSNNLAYLWYAIAEQRGAGGAGAKKDAVAARLQPTELEQVKKQLQDFARPAK